MLKLLLNQIPKIINNEPTIHTLLAMLHDKIISFNINSHRRQAPNFLYKIWFKHRQYVDCRPH